MTWEDQLFVSGFVNRLAQGHPADALAEDRVLRGGNPSADRNLHTAAGPDGWLTPIVWSHLFCRRSHKAQNPTGLGGQRPPFHPQIPLPSRLFLAARQTMCDFDGCFFLRLERFNLTIGAQSRPLPIKTSIGGKNLGSVPRRRHPHSAGLCAGSPRPCSGGEVPDGRFDPCQTSR